MRTALDTFLYVKEKKRKEKEHANRGVNNHFIIHIFSVCLHCQNRKSYLWFVNLEVLEMGVLFFGENKYHIQYIRLYLGFNLLLNACMQLYRSIIYWQNVEHILSPKLMMFNKRSK